MHHVPRQPDFGRAGSFYKNVPGCIAPAGRYYMMSLSLDGRLSKMHGPKLKTKTKIRTYNYRPPCLQNTPGMNTITLTRFLN